VRRFVAGQPQASVSITPLESPALEASLAEQRFDLGLTERREAPPATSLTTLLQADEVAVLPDGHPLLARAMLRPLDFEGCDFISFSAADPYRSLVDALFTRHGVARRMALDTGSAVSVCALVRQGLGVSIVNPLTALALAGGCADASPGGPTAGAAPGLHLRPLSESIAFHVGLVLPQLRPANPLRAAFVEALQQAADAVKQLAPRPAGKLRKLS
jgi:hypothetical protein